MTEPVVASRKPHSQIIDLFDGVLTRGKRLGEQHRFHHIAPKNQM